MTPGVMEGDWRKNDFLWALLHASPHHKHTWFPNILLPDLQLTFPTFNLSASGSQAQACSLLRHCATQACWPLAQLAVPAAGKLCGQGWGWRQQVLNAAPEMLGRPGGLGLRARAAALCWVDD